MTPMSFNFSLASHTARFSSLLTMIIILIVSGALVPLLLPIPFFIAAIIEIIREFIRYRRTFRYRSDDAVALTAAVRRLFPGAPDITPPRLASLIRAGKLTVDGDDGSRLRLVLSDRVSLKKMRDGYTIRAALCPADFGLAELDRIMGDLVHSGPVAAAVGRIKAEERAMKPVLSPEDLPYPAKPDMVVTEERSSWTQAYVDKDEVARKKKKKQEKEAARAR